MIHYKLICLFIFTLFFFFLFREKYYYFLILIEVKQQQQQQKVMSFLFGKKLTPEEMLRNNQRALNKAMRDLDRERQQLENQEKKVIVDIKKMAKMGQMDAVKVMAKDLVRTRATCKKFMIMKANIQAVSLKITTLKSNHAMAQAMKGVTKAMATMNKKVINEREICFLFLYEILLISKLIVENFFFSKMNLPEIQRIMMEFEKQSEIMDMKEEMMDDAIDSALGDDDDEIEG